MTIEEAKKHIHELVDRAIRSDLVDAEEVSLSANSWDLIKKELTKPKLEWITDRLPTVEDANECGLVAVLYLDDPLRTTTIEPFLLVKRGQPWHPLLSSSSKLIQTP